MKYPLQFFISYYCSWQNPRKKRLLEDYDLPVYFRDDLFKYASEEKRPPYRLLYRISYFAQVAVIKKSIWKYRNRLQVGCDRAAKVRYWHSHRSARDECVERSRFRPQTVVIVVDVSWISRLWYRNCAGGACFPLTRRKNWLRWLRKRAASNKTKPLRGFV